MSEDEALAAALAASLGSGGSQEAGGQGPRSASEEEEDRMLPWPWLRVRGWRLIVRDRGKAPPLGETRAAACSDL